jgi:peptidoglycan/LPS O-acetylase OafA/YrhL
MPKINSENYRHDIDGLRALAVLPVLLFHAKLGCPGGFVGVDIFYVISGYLISSLILKDLHDGIFSLITFWERRIRRILPALAVVVFATLVAGWFLFLPDDFAMLGKSVVAQMTLLANVFFYRQGLAGGGYFAPTPAPKPLLHTWSLAVEEQFYLLFPLLLIFLARYGRLRLLNAIVVFAVGSFVLSVYGSYYHQQATFYLLPARAWELALGALLVLLRGRLSAGGAVRETCGWLGIGLIGFAIFCYDDGTRFPGLAAVPPCLGAVLIIFSSELRVSIVGRILTFKPVVFIGLISYSLYLWHWPLLVFSKYVRREDPTTILRAITLLASTVLAILTWKYIETPFRKRWVLHKHQQIFGFAGVSTATLLLLGFVVLREHGFPSRLPEKALRFAESWNHSAFLNEISLEQALAGHFAELGSQPTNQPIKILVWGDSHAMAVTPGFDDLCRRFSWRGIEATHSATAPLLGWFNNDKDSLLEKSPLFNNAVLEFIKSNHVENVVLVGSWLAYSKNSDAFNTQLIATVRAIMAAGARIYVLKDVPHRGGFDVPRVAAICAMHNGDLEQLGVIPEEWQMANRRVNKTFEQISQLGATVLDSAPYFLNRQGRYGVVKNDQVLFRDYHHLTVEGSRILAPLFEPIFQPKTN